MSKYWFAAIYMSVIATLAVTALKANKLAAENTVLQAQVDGLETRVDSLQALLNYERSDPLWEDVVIHEMLSMTDTVLSPINTRPLKSVDTLACGCVTTYYYGLGIGWTDVPSTCPDHYPKSWEVK